jgi:hypothetical protein
MKQVHKWLPAVSFGSTFLGNAVDNINSQVDLVAKGKTLVNAVTGKVTGINLFSGVPQFGVKVGFPNLSHPLVVSGVTMLALGWVGTKLKIPHTGKVKRIGADIAIPALIGSIFQGDVGVGSITQTPSLLSAQGVNTV